MNGAMMIPEYDHEFAQTRRSLERLPEDRFDYKPHDKSWSLKELASHLVEIPGWAAVTINVDLLDFDEPMERTLPETKAEMLEAFDKNVAEGRTAVEGASGDTLMETWSMKAGGEIIMSLPRAAVLRSFVMNHNIHHRAQLGVYLRMLGVPVPAIYGPSADEQGM